MIQTNKKKAEFLSLLFYTLGGLVLLFIIAPLVSLYLSCTIPELVETAKEQEVQSSIWLTLWTSMAATLIFAIAAIPFSYLLARKEFPFKNLVLGIIDLPIVIPHSAAGIALLGVISRNGLLGKGAEAMGFSLVGNSLGIILAMAFVSIPFLINSARNGFLKINHFRIDLDVGPGHERVWCGNYYCIPSDGYPSFDLRAFRSVWS
ncbi:MAG: hypothetical protein ACYSSP_13765 [Planctomycetota bacterium]|jgi:molybdate/tungstate transport system permease protein